MDNLLFSRASTTYLHPNFNFDEDSVEDLIWYEEKKLKAIQCEFMYEFGLCQAQLKLIHALQHLLTMLATPTVSPEELMQQFSKIVALYHDVDGALRSAQKHKDIVANEVQTQVLEDQERLRLANLIYQEQVSSAHRAYAFQEFTKHALKLEAEKQKAKKEEKARKEVERKQVLKESEIYLERCEIKSTLSLLASLRHSKNKRVSPSALRRLNAKLICIRFKQHLHNDTAICNTYRSLARSGIKLSFLLRHPGKTKLAPLLADIQTDLLTLEKANSHSLRGLRCSPFSLPKPTLIR